MSQEIGRVTLSQGMSLVVTLSRDCATPLRERATTIVSWEKMPKKAGACPKREIDT
jgi:hypothetical protein